MSEDSLKVLLDGLTAENELAVRLGFAPRTVKRWRAAGIGPKPTFVGRRIFYTTEDVAEWLTASNTRRFKAVA